MALIRPYLTDSRFCIAFWQNVAIVDIGGELDLRRMKKLGGSYTKLLEHHPLGIVALVMVRPATPVATADARSEIARNNKELGDRLLQVASVIEDRGLMAQVMRTMVRGVSMLTGHTRIQMHADVESALVGLQPFVAPPHGVADVLNPMRAAVLTVRAGFRPVVSSLPSSTR